jgi:hypothetical protein
MSVNNAILTTGSGGHFALTEARRGRVRINDKEATRG